MDRNFALEFVRVTEAAAIASAKLMGRGDETAADLAAVEAMRQRMNSIQFDGRVVIGEGERDEAPMLYIGERVGAGDGPKLDLALDPLEGTTICANGGTNALSVIAIADEGNFLHAPDVYMEKIAVGPSCKGIIDLNLGVTENLRRIAAQKNIPVQSLTVIILDRPRHAELMHEVRGLGSRIWLIGDGDVSAAIATCKRSGGVDVLVGTGGAPEGVIAAAALRCMGGDFQGRLIFRTDAERARARKMGITDLNKVYQIDELAKGPVMFSATGVTQGTFLDGVQFKGTQRITTHSVVMRSDTGTIRYIEAEHHIGTEPN
ncbi:MAG TPA: fructose-bisphosphatase class II [Bdellovibrionales bacterium]|nr:MAG: fructose-bisphosphatase, class II [Bdellovibrionales bacterium GWB1_52_6]OFZ04858.1 MAG: fructose-bisphosphatase, class II [Bdellovibrionales bacterium GWA1_52_35]OFZ38333.1 MAG: fructose-bisphosphatase, class II [Bdellovibrionales bacterium GWC1_52_8]HAR44399.1 fructose-bisphosphatase class II [Bdellovibrionales bacterium]HCM38944.1 class II fructose-bisphosphatase [Bdellovibrionales bacterium]